MNNRISFTVLGRPAPQGSMKSFGKGRMGCDNPRTLPWRQQVGWSALEARAKAGICAPWAKEVAVSVNCVFYFARPKSAKKREYPTVKPDRDKLERAIGDALTGVLYMDDSQWVDGHATKLYGLPERVEISVEVIA